MTGWSQAVSAGPTKDLGTPSETVTGNRGLQIEEGLIFAQDSPGQWQLVPVLPGDLRHLEVVPGFLIGEAEDHSCRTRAPCA